MAHAGQRVTDKKGGTCLIQYGIGEGLKHCAIINPHFWLVEDRHLSACKCRVGGHLKAANGKNKLGNPKLGMSVWEKRTLVFRGPSIAGFV